MGFVRKSSRARRVWRMKISQFLSQHQHVSPVPAAFFVLTVAVGAFSFSSQVRRLLPFSSSVEAQVGTLSENPPTTSSDFTQQLFFNVPTTVNELLTAAVLAVEGESSFGGAAQFSGPVAFAQDVLIDGKLTLKQNITGTNIDIDLQTGKVFASNLVYSVTAGSGVSVRGDQDLVVENTDKGSDQKIFKKIKVGDQTIVADNNSDELSLQAGSGITLSRSGDQITIAGAADSGWERPSSGVVALVTASDKVGIGTSSPSNTLEIASQVDGMSGLTFANLTSGATAGVGGGKVLTVDSGGKVILVQDQTGSTPNAEDILPDTETGGTIYFNGMNWVSTTNLFHNGGSVGISTTDPQGRLHVLSNAVGTRGLIVQGVTGQTVNLQEWRDGNGAVVAAISPDGGFSGKIDGSVAFTGLTDGILSMNSGSLSSLSTLGPSYITADSLDFSEFKDALTLDASTTIAAGNVFGLTLVSDLTSGNRGPASTVLSISQANNATYNNTTSGGLLNVTNSDTGSSGIVAQFVQNGTGYGVFVSGTTTSGLLTISPNVAGKALQIFSENMTTGSAIKLDNGGTTIATSLTFSGDIIAARPGKNLIGGSTVLTESGNYLDIRREINAASVGSIANITGDVAILESSCNASFNSGTCNDSATILSVSQLYANATGDVIELTNVGSGDALELLGAGSRSINSTSGNITLKTTTSGNVVVNSAGTIELEDNTNITGGLAVTGNITSINGLSYTWPSSHTTNGILTNSGNGTLTWGTISSSMITADSLDFSEFKDAMALDASTTVSAGNAFNFAFTSDLSTASRTSSPVMSITQANNATYNSSVSTGLFSVSNLDTGSSGPLVYFNQSSEDGIGLQINGNVAGNLARGSLRLSGITTGNGISSNAETLTTGTLMRLGSGGQSYGSGGTFSGDIIEFSASKVVSGATFTESGNYLDLRRVMYTSNGAATINVTGDLANLESFCQAVVFSGTCNDSANVLSIAQKYSGATGDVIELNNVGSGDALEIIGAGSRSINSTSGNITLKTTTSGNVIVNSAGTIELQDNTNITGDLNITGACTGCSSDIRLKQDIQSLSGSSLEKLLSIRGVSYVYSDGEKSKYLPGKQLGVIAQDVEAVFPELVGTDSRGFKYVRYDHLIAPTIEAIREQQQHLMTLDRSVLVLSTSLPSQQLNADGSVTPTGVDPQLEELETRVASLELQIEQLASNSGRLQTTEQQPRIAQWFQGSWKFFADVVFAGKARFEQAVTFLADVSFGGRVSYEDPDMAGVITFQANESVAEVVFEKPYEQKPIITLALDNYDGKYKLDVTETGFTLRLTPSATEPMSINWIAVSAKNAKQTTAQAAEENTSEQESTESVEDVSLPSPTPSPLSILGNSEAATISAAVLP